MHHSQPSEAMAQHLPEYQLLWPFVLLQAAKPRSHLELEKRESSCFPVCSGSSRTALKASR